ncbi:hypothetical protein PV392_06645 [Streptomyces sp. ME03-5709C]|nr:hypothetical protein [Streptomyces sp. ME03-5709C]
MLFWPTQEREEFDKLVVRTHFGDEEAWQEVLAAAAEPWDDGEGESTSLVVDDRSWEGATVERVTEFLAEKDPHLPVVFVADESSMCTAHHALLAVNLDDEENFLDTEYDAEHGTVFGRRFRIVPNEASGMHVNLTLANMDYEDWAETASRSADGVFHGFE